MKHSLWMLLLILLTSCSSTYDYNVGRGYDYYLYGDYDMAISYFNKALEQDPVNSNAYVGLGNVYYKQGQHDKALENYDKAIELDPNNYAAYGERALYYSYKEEYKRALNDYDKAISLEDKNAHLYNNRGYTYLLLGDLDKAELDIKKALSINKRNQFANMSMAELLAMKSDNDGACKWINKAKKNGLTDLGCAKTSAIRKLPCYKEKAGIEDNC